MGAKEKQKLYKRWNALKKIYIYRRLYSVISTHKN